MTGLQGTDAGTPLPTEARIKRALWRATHRGTKEMDLILGRFAEARLAHMSPEELDRFEQLLQMPDPDLHRWIVDPTSLGDSTFASEIAAIRRFNGLATGA